MQLLDLYDVIISVFHFTVVDLSLVYVQDFTVVDRSLVYIYKGDPQQ
jgi:hypothetical protein